MTHAKLDLPTQIDLVQFISEQAHDLRTPFNLITGFGKMLLNSSVSGEVFTDVQREDLGTVYRSGQRALSLINGLIDMARLQRREKEVYLAEVEIRSLLEQSIIQWKKFNPDTALQPEYQISISATSLRADELLLRQIFASLMSYVAQYADPHAKIILMIEEESAQPIVTVSSIGTKTQPTSQLDLHMHGYIARALVELLQGEIRLAEETDEGAMIQFALSQA